MAAILTDFAAFATAAIGVIGDVVTEVVAQPVLLIGILAGILMLGVGLVKKFI